MVKEISAQPTTVQLIDRRTDPQRCVDASEYCVSGLRMERGEIDVWREWEWIWGIRKRRPNDTGVN